MQPDLELVGRAAGRQRDRLRQRVRMRGAVAVEPGVPAAGAGRLAATTVDHAGGGRPRCRASGLETGIAEQLHGRARTRRGTRLSTQWTFAEGVHRTDLVE